MALASMSGLFKFRTIQSLCIDPSKATVLDRGPDIRGLRRLY